MDYLRKYWNLNLWFLLLTCLGFLTLAFLNLLIYRSLPGSVGGQLAREIGLWCVYLGTIVMALMLPKLYWLLGREIGSTWQALKEEIRLWRES